MTRRRRHRRNPTWMPANAAEVHAAAEAVALCNTPQGRELRLWIRLCWLRDQTLPWVEILHALRQEMAAVLPIAAE